MIISASHQFVFVHIPKSAGTSVRSALARFADGNSAALPDTTHETLAALLTRHPDLTTQFKFAFVRNPWERLVSFFFHAKQKLGRSFPQFQAMEELKTMLRLLEQNETWLCDMHAIRPQCDYICGGDGRRLTDFVGRYEHLDADFALACRRAGIAAVLPKQNVSRHGRYTDYYDDWCRDFVTARYAQDIGEFGYTFGSAGA
jgi:hypothetical protein